MRNSFATGKYPHRCSDTSTPQTGTEPSPDRTGDKYRPDYDGMAELFDDMEALLAARQSPEQNLN
jgi:hypothetical protein